jgi:hypothetical protein
MCEFINLALEMAFSKDKLSGKNIIQIIRPEYRALEMNCKITNIGNLYFALPINLNESFIKINKLFINYGN